MRSLRSLKKSDMRIRFMEVTQKRFSIVAVIAGGLLSADLAFAAQSRHVVVVVWDGMRPDFVSEENTPALWKLAKDGVVFRNHHSVFPSATNVNGAALATGDYPSHTGLIANHEFRPNINNRRPVGVEEPDVVRKGDELSGRKYVAAPTIAELVQKSGRHTIIAASKTVGLLHDRHFDARQKNGVTLSAGMTWPSEILGKVAVALGSFPKSHSEQDNWTTKALTDLLWKDGVPAFSLLWLGEPDLTQHETAPGAAAALRAIKSSDDNLAAVLSALERQHARGATDVFVVSDHGFSTIEREIELPKILADAGFDVVKEFKSEPQPGQIMIVGGGGSVLFYVIQHDPAVTQRLVEFLQRSDFAGVIFTKKEFEGTFTLDQGEIDTPDAPDAVLSFRWNENKNQFGIAGMIDADWQRAAGKGTHAPLSRFDMHNMLIAAGPDFRRGQADDLPSGNVDLAPTILTILGIAVPHPVDGRILSEAMAATDLQPLKPETETLEATKSFSSGIWRQALHISRVGPTIYLDEGNGVFVSER